MLGIRVLRSLGPENLPRLNHVTMDPTVVGFAVITGLMSVGIFGLIPRSASGTDVMDVLRKVSRTSGLSASGWLRSGVVTIEVALCFVLLVGSGLMSRSFIALQRAQPGYDPRNVLTFLIPDLRLPDPKARQAFMANLRGRLNGLPGVLAVTAASPFHSTAVRVWRAKGGGSTGRSHEIPAGDRALRHAWIFRSNADAGSRRTDLQRR